MFTIYSRDSRFEFLRVLQGFNSFLFSEKYLKNVSYLLSSYLDKVTWTNQLSIVKSYNQIFDKYYF